MAFNSGISLQFSGLPRLGVWTAIRHFKPTHSPKVDGPSDGGMEEENSLERASFGTHSKSASFRLVAAYIRTLVTIAPIFILPSGYLCILLCFIDK